MQFACESFVDEMAHAARVDPAEFRRRHLTDPREVTVIDAVVAASGWTSRPPGSRGRGAVMSGYGLAAGPMFGTYVAIVCQAEVDGASGRVWVRRVFVAHDCGLVINPLGLRGAIEGAVVQGLSRTLWEEVQFDSRSVTSVDWNTYPILDIRDVPESVEIVVIDGKGRPASGAGEAAHVFVPAAVANAVFDATGVRMRTLPLRSERVRAAMSAAVDRISGVAAL